MIPRDVNLMIKNVNAGVVQGVWRATANEGVCSRNRRQASQFFLFEKFFKTGSHSE
jgi:hypothetical protein